MSDFDEWFKDGEIVLLRALPAELVDKIKEMAEGAYTAGRKRGVKDAEHVATVQHFLKNRTNSALCVGGCMNNDELLKLAFECGFETPESAVGLSGNSELDESIFVGEYPVGESLIKFARAVEQAARATDAKAVPDHKKLILKMAESGELPSFEEVYKHYEYTMIDCINMESKSKAAMLGVSLRVLDIFDKYKERDQ